MPDGDVTQFFSNASCWSPDHLCDPLGWVGHVPFAFWIVGACRPRRLVELGTHSGNSYLAMCQAVRGHALDCHCYAVDTWKGDQHAGLYDESVFERVEEINRTCFNLFSNLVRSTFDDAVGQFADASIDLLHIDGCHTYEAVKHDFETWLPKMSPRGVVLLHDTNVHEREFGVNRFFEELEERFPGFNFLHSHGLGTVAVGSEPPALVLRLAEAARDEACCREIRQCYSRLGKALVDKRCRDQLAEANLSLGHQLENAQRELRWATECLAANAQTLSANAQALGANAQTLGANAETIRDLVRVNGEIQNAIDAMRSHALALEERNEHLGQRVHSVERENELLRQVGEDLQVEIESIRRSLSWAVIEKLGTVRRLLASEGTLRGRLLNATVRRMKTHRSHGSAAMNQR